MIVIVIFLSPVFALSFYYYYSLFKTLMKCTFMVEAEIIDIKIEKDIDGEGNISTSSNPVFRYYYNGREYISSEDIGYPGLKYEKGDILNIYINPEYPYEVVDKKRKIKSHIAAGTICLLFCISVITLKLLLRE